MKKIRNALPVILLSLISANTLALGLGDSVIIPYNSKISVKNPDGIGEFPMNSVCISSAPSRFYIADINDGIATVAYASENIPNPVQCPQNGLISEVSLENLERMREEHFQKRLAFMPCKSADTSNLPTLPRNNMASSFVSMHTVIDGVRYTGCVGRSTQIITVKINK